MKTNFFSFLYSRWYKMLIIIAFVSLAIGLVFSILFDKEWTFFGLLFPSILNTIILWTGSIFIANFVWNKYPWEKFPVKHLVVEALMILAFLIVFILLINLYYSKIQQISYLQGLKNHASDIVLTALITFWITTIHEAAAFYRQWKLNFSKSIQLEKDNLEAKYDALKAQVNPHFLFNSLNSLITMLNENPSAEKYVQSLSDYLRYALVSNTKETVTLEEEMENVKKYVYLQQSRFGDNFTFEAQITDEALHKHIPTLALQMLVENCFVHNVISKDKKLHILVKVDKNTVSVENNFQKKSGITTTGKGLKNIEGRYRFIETDAVKITADERTFKVTIPLI